MPIIVTYPLIFYWLLKDKDHFPPSPPPLLLILNGAQSKSQHDDKKNRGKWRYEGDNQETNIEMDTLTLVGHKIASKLPCNQ
jgi:hypothetical protein